MIFSSAGCLNFQDFLPFSELFRSLVFVVFRRIFLLHAKKKQSHSAQVSATLKIYVYVWQFATGEKPLFLVQIRAYNVVMYTKNTHTAMNPWWVTLERRNRRLHFTIRASTSTLEPIESPACASVALAPTRSEQWLQHRRRDMA